ncbi:unnamed protein product [Musa banksii]
MPLHNMLHCAGSLHRQCLQHVRIVRGIPCHVPEAHLCHIYFRAIRENQLVQGIPI